MGLIPTEIEELRSLLKLMDQGKISHEQLVDKIAVYSQLEKRERLILQAFAIGAKNGKTLTRVLKSNLIGEMEAVDAGKSPSIEKIIYGLEGKTIVLRQECLDLSGKPANYEFCKECPNFGLTRRLLITE
jgi:hypothetical protein